MYAKDLCCSRKLSSSSTQLLYRGTRRACAWTKVRSAGRACNAAAACTHQTDVQGCIHRAAGILIALAFAHVKTSRGTKHRQCQTDSHAAGVEKPESAGVPTRVRACTHMQMQMQMQMDMQADTHAHARARPPHPSSTHTHARAHTRSLYLSLCHTPPHPCPCPHMHAPWL